MSQVRDTVLMSVYLEVRNPGGRDSGVGGYISKGGKWGVQFTSNRRPRWTDPVTARRVPSKYKGIRKGNKGNKGSKGNQQGEMRKARGTRHVYCNLSSCT